MNPVGLRVAVATLLLVTGCASATIAERPDPPVAGPGAVPSTATSDPPAGGVAAEPATRSTTPTTSAAPTTISPAPTPPCPAPHRLDTGAEAPPAALLDALDRALAAGAWAGLDTSVSIWVEGYGEIASRSADLALLPASNQKLFSAIGAHLLLDLDAAFVTEVRRSGSDFVLVAGGDPTLTTSGPSSLDELARQARGAGVTEVGRVLVDATRFEVATTVAGWQDWHVPQYVGPLSALTVDDNRHRTDPGFLQHPALGNGERFAERLRRAGITVSGPVVVGAGPRDGELVASVRSAPVRDLLRTMLLSSDNEIAEALIRLIGDGSTAEGIARVDGALEAWCLDLAGASGDGSGLSRANLRSAREWRRLLQVAAGQPWAAELVDALPRSGRTGTLAGRLAADGVAGAVSAKTGSIIGGRALSGYATTASGRRAVFSIVTNGEPTRVAAARPAIDALVEALVRHG